MTPELLSTSLMVVLLFVGIPLTIASMRVKNLRLTLAQNIFWVLFSFTSMIADYQKDSGFMYMWGGFLLAYVCMTTLTALRVFKDPKQ